MGFPLSTDIFGQLKWLVKQVKLLVFRVTRIEQGGGGGAQNISQVLATGNTATDKTLKIINNSGSAELFGNYLKIQAATPISSNTMYGYQQIEMLTDNNTSIVLGGGGGYNTGGISFTNGSNLLVADSNQIFLNTYNVGTGATNSFLSNSFYLQFTETDSNNNSLYALYGRTQIAMYDSASNGSLNIGKVEGYLGASGFTITNGIGDSVSCDSTRYVITNATSNGTKTNIINASSITATSTAAGAFPVILHFDANTTQIYSQFNNAEIGLNLSPLARTYTIGEERLSGDSYFGINSIDNKLVAGVSLLQTTGAHNNPAGFVEIYINNQSYWIEIWNDTP